MSETSPTVKRSAPGQPLGYKNTIEKLFGIDLRSLAAFRIGLGIMLIADLINRSFSLRDLYTDEGVLPADELVEAVGRMSQVSIHYYFSDQPSVIIGLFWLAGLFAFLLMIGCFTRVMTVLSWFMFISLSNRNPAVLSAGDSILRVLLTWSIFLPLGARWSVDIIRWPVYRTYSNHFVSLPTFAILMQVCIIYWFTGLHKHSPIWWKGEAVYMALSLDWYVTPFGKWLLTQRALLPPLTYGTLFLEILGPFFAFIPWKFTWFRSATVLAFITFHIGLMLCMNLAVFEWISITAWLLFIPAAWWDALGRVVPSLRKYQANRQRLDSSRFFGVLTGILLAYVFVMNVANLEDAPFMPQGTGSLMPYEVRRIGSLTQLKQSWKMFAPEPARSDGWFVVPATLADGSEVDLFKDGGPVDWLKPESVTHSFKSVRWRRFILGHGKLETLRNPTPNWRHYADWLCRDWNRRHPPERHVESLTIYYIMEFTPRPHEIAHGLEEFKLIEYSCANGVISGDSTSQ